MDLMRVRPAAFVALALGLVACSGAQHRKPKGPPPEYELPEEPDGWAPPSPAAGRATRDAGQQ